MAREGVSPSVQPKVDLEPGISRLNFGPQEVWEQPKAPSELSITVHRTAEKNDRDRNAGDGNVNVGDVLVKCPFPRKASR